MSTFLLPALTAARPDLVVVDVLTAAGSFAAERAGLPWVELSPHPLYLPSTGLPPMLSGVAPGRGPASGRLGVLISPAVTRPCALGTPPGHGARRCGA